MKQHRDLILFVILVVLIGGLLIWDARHEAERLQTLTHQHMQIAVSQLNDSLQRTIARLHRLAGLFAADQAALLERLHDYPDDSDTYQRLLAKAQGYFPDLLAVTLADLEGRVLLPQQQERIGKGCRSDIGRFAQALRTTGQRHVYSPHIHGNPTGAGSGYHFDIMVPWRNGNEGIFFVSIRSDLLTRILKRHENPLYHLVLLDAQDPRRLELDASNSHGHPLSADLLVGNPVAGTAWRVGAIPDATEQARQVIQIWQRNLALFIATLALLGGGLFLLRREHRRNQALRRLNEQYQQEISYREAAERRLAELARFDPLTTLPNQATAREFLQQALDDAREQHCRPAVFFLDIDHFARINDSLGHQAGDALVTRLARRLGEQVRAGDMLARWGGDEFLVIVRDASNHVALTRHAERLAETTHRPFDLRGHKVVATLSIGIATWPEAGETADELIKNADHALQQTKSEGRNTWRFFLQEMNEEALRRIGLEADIRRGLSEGEFEPWYQPKYDLIKDRYCGAEVLMRWRHPDKGILAPATFLKLIEENGLIEPVGDQVRNRVCNDVLAWQEQGVPVGQLAVNLSSREFRKERLVDQLHERIANCGLDPGQFQIEITEGQMMADTAASLARLYALREIGFHLAIDDFGTGYSSLAYLRRFPVDTLKIDRSFVSECDCRGEDRDILEMIVQLAHGLSLKVVAEGVENRTQLELLREIGCDQIQGYHYAKPMPAEKFERFVLSHAVQSDG